jgi:hypothetical protein
MYEQLVAYKDILAGLGILAVIIFSVLAVGSAWMFQGKSERKLSGPLYSTYIAVTVVAVMSITAGYLVYLGSRITMIFGIVTFAFSLMILFTVSVLCWASMNRERGLSTGRGQPEPKLFTFF